MPYLLVARGRGALVHGPLLNPPNPKRQTALQKGIRSNGNSGIQLGVVETKLVIPQRAGGSDGEGAVAESEAHVGHGVLLGEADRVEVVRDGIVGAILQVCLVIARVSARAQERMGGWEEHEEYVDGPAWL